MPHSYIKQLFNKDDKYFRKYIENTTAHGVVRIFSGKSVMRRLFWLVIVLGATGGCLFNISNRIIYLAGAPTATTLSLERQNNLTFPTVTICNLNQYRRDGIDSIHPDLADLLRSVHYTDPTDSNDTSDCRYDVQNFTSQAPNLINHTLMNISYIGRERYDDFILYCYFSGTQCNESHFERFDSDIGYCFQFNSARQNPLFEAVSTGTRAGLYLAININQSQYIGSSSFDAGVKVVVHTRNEPPKAEDTGVGVPPGTNAFIGVRQRNIIDKTLRDCTPRDSSSNSEYDYTFASCRFECLLRAIADNCNCLYERTDDQDLQLCTLADICCVSEQQRLTVDCDCPAACNTTEYQLFNSYSTFPAQYTSSEFEDRGIINELFRDNLLSVNVFFETLNIETQTTEFSYGVVALLSDIGGQLGLFLGVSVISIMELGTWIIDELKSRLCGDKLSERKLCACCKKRIDDSETEEVDMKQDNGSNEKLSKSDYVKQESVTL